MAGRIGRKGKPIIEEKWSADKRMIKLRQDQHIWYHLSCGCIVKHLDGRIGNTGICRVCQSVGLWPRVFVLKVVYVKPLEDD